jgi:hypothetical protein
LALAGVARRQGVADDSTRLPERGQLGIDPGLDLLKSPALRRARGAACVMGRERIGDLLDGEPELLELAGQPDPIDISPFERAVPARRTWRRSQDTATLVEPDRVDRHPDRLGELADLHGPIMKRLTLDHGPEFTVSRMTTLLSITADPAAPVACDLSSSSDTLEERLAEYRRLFEHALVGRASTPTATTFRFAARPGVAEWVRDLATREAACCAFVSYEIELDEEDDEIVWTTSGGLGASEMSILDEFLSADPVARGSEEIARRLEDRGFPVIGS